MGNRDKGSRRKGRLYGEYPVKFQMGIFAMLMEEGEFRAEEPEAVAREFYGVIFWLLHTCDSLQEAKPFIREHVKQFVTNYRKDTRRES